MLNNSLSKGFIFTNMLFSDIELPSVSLWVPVGIMIVSAEPLKLEWRKNSSPIETLGWTQRNSFVLQSTQVWHKDVLDHLINSGSNSVRFGSASTRTARVGGEPTLCNQ